MDSGALGHTRFRRGEQAKHHGQLESGDTVTKILRFIPARLRDNPYLGPQYEANLQRLPSAERAALLDGRWGVVDVPGSIYADVLNKAREEKRICRVPYDRAAVVDATGTSGTARSWLCGASSGWGESGTSSITILGKGNQPQIPTETNSPLITLIG